MTAVQDAFAGETPARTFGAFCEDAAEASELYRLYASRLQWARETTSGA